MANVFTVMPIYIDTDTTTGAGTNWRGASGGQLLSANVKGIMPSKVVIAAAAGGVATVAGTVVINDPQQSSGNLLSIPIIAAQASPIEIDVRGALWRDFIVTGVTAAKVALQIYYNNCY